MNTIKPDSIFIRKEDEDNYLSGDIVRVAYILYGDQIWFNRFIRRPDLYMKTDSWNYYENIKNFLRKYKEIKLVDEHDVSEFLIKNINLVIKTGKRYFYMTKKQNMVIVDIVGYDKIRNMVYFKKEVRSNNWARMGSIDIRGFLNIMHPCD